MLLYDTSNRRILVMRYGITGPHVIWCEFQIHSCEVLQTRYYLNGVLRKESCIDSVSLYIDIIQRD